MNYNLTHIIYESYSEVGKSGVIFIMLKSRDQVLIHDSWLVTILPISDHIPWHHTKAEAVRIRKTDEQNRRIIDENETKIKQLKTNISIFLGSITGRVRFVKLTCEIKKNCKVSNPL